MKNNYIYIMIKKIILVILIVVSSYGLKSQCLQLDILLVADFSGSVNGYEPFIKNAFTEFIDRFDLSEGGVKIGVVAFSDYAYSIADITTDKDVLYNAINYMDIIFSHGSTNLYQALSVSHIEMQENGRSGINKMIILVSDGAYNGPDSEKTIMKVNEIKSDKIMICGVLITTSTQEPDTMMMLSDEFCYMESSYQALADVLKNMEICV